MCGAKILFAYNSDGKSVPVNATRARVYRQDPVNLGEQIREVQGNDRKPLLFFISHFLTCTDPDKHSTGKRDLSTDSPQGP